MVNAENRKRLEQRLDETARRWKSMPSEGNEAAAQALKNQIWLLVFQLYEREDPAGGDEAVLNALEEAFARYAPEQGAFSHYFSLLLSGRKKDAYRYGQRHAPGGDSLDRPVSEDGGLTLGDALAADEASEPGYALEVDGLFAELTSLILNFSARRDRAGNETRRMWYRLFYTEDMTQAMKARRFRFLHERDIFTAMDTGYLDYYMTAVCRTGREVMAAPLKRCRDVMPESEDTREVPFPFPAGVSLGYLRSCKGIEVGGSARSNQIGAYRKEKAAICSL